MTCRILLFVTIASFGFTANAQFADSLKIEVGTTATLAAKEYQPLWLTSNRFGTIADRKNDASTFISVHNIHRFASGANADSLLKPWYVSYGAAVYNNNHFNDVFAEQLYVKAGYKKWEFRAGRFEETPGDLDFATSSGSLGVSGNALPIPKIGFAVVDYLPVPYTNNFLQFKGQISHGWFNNNRYMQNALYHEKTFYLQLGRKKFKLYGGVQHFVEWGGKRGDVQLERSFKGFLDVLLVREADDGSVGTSANGILPNRPGDQRGLLEAGFKWENEKLLLHGYQQTPFETGRDVDPRNIDRLVGLAYHSKKAGGFLQTISAELLYTRDMLSFVEQSDRQSYYNNGAYKTGWEYNDRIIGTPLFINRVRASKYFTTYQPYDWNAPDNSIYGNDNIVNNRVVAFHLGALYNIGGNVQAKTLLTYSQNYGTHDPTSPFVPHKNQLYTLQQVQYHFAKQGVRLLAGIAIDNGELSDNTGFMFGFAKSLK